MPAKKTAAPKPAKPLTARSFKSPIEAAYKAIDKRAVVRNRKPSPWVPVTLPGNVRCEIRSIYITNYRAGEVGWSRLELRGTDFNGNNFLGCITDYGANLYIALASQANAHGITA